ncbi:hypothetical protein D3C79_1110870 [compost metagenome]
MEVELVGARGQAVPGHLDDLHAALIPGLKLEAAQLRVLREGEGFGQNGQVAGTAHS